MRVFLLFFLVAFKAVASPYMIFRENGRVGLKNETGKIIIPAQYDDIGWSDGTFSVLGNVTGCKSGKFWGLVNVQNQQLTKHEFEELVPGDQNVVIAKKKNRTGIHSFFGVISITGKEIIPFLYEGISINSFRAIVYSKIGNLYKYGLLDLNNKTLIPQQFQDIRSVGSLRYSARNFEGKQALFTENGKQISEFTIDSISSFKKNYAILYEGKYQGLIDRNGQVKLTSKFREIIIEDDGRILAREPDQWSVLEGQNKIVKRIKADSLSVISKNLYKVETSGQVQIVDRNFFSIVDGVFSQIGNFVNGKAPYYLKKLVGVIQMDGTVLVPAIYTDVRIGPTFILANARQGGKDSWVLFDSSGTRKSEKSYQSILPTDQGYFVIQQKGFFGLLNSEGEEIVKNIFDSVLQVKDNYLVVKFHGMYGVIDITERWIVTPKANKILLLGKDRLLEFTPTTTNLKSLGGELIYFTSNQISIGQEHLLETVSNGNIWKIDFDGIIVERQLQPVEQTEVIFEESEGLRAIKRNGRFGFIDSKGRLRIANRYEAVKPFKEGLAAVKILGKWGFINMQDNLAIQPVYEEVFQFENDRAFVKQKGLFGLIDRTGKLIMPVRYEKIVVLPTGYLLFSLNGLKGLADRTGKVMITPRYDELIDTGSNFVIVVKDNKYGLLSLQGINTVPMMYRYISYNSFEDVFLALEKSEWQVIN